MWSNLKSKALKWMGISDAVNRQYPDRLNRIVFGEQYNREYDVLMTEYDYNTERGWSRYLYHNNGMCSGIVDEISYLSIDGAFEFKSFIPDRSVASQYVDYIKEWQNIGNVRGWNVAKSLFAASVSALTDGDLLSVDRLSRDKSTALFQLIPSHAIGRTLTEIKDGRFIGYKMSSGIITNGFERPIGFNIMGDNPKEDVRISARDALLVGDFKRIDEIRGRPVFASSIDVFRNLKMTDDLEIIAQKINAALVLKHSGKQNIMDSFGSYLGETESERDNPTTIKYLMGGEILYLGEGDGKLDAHMANRPGVQTMEFQKQLKIMAYKGAGWPYALSYDPTLLNNSSTTRMVIIQAQKRLNHHIDNVLEPLWRRWITFALAVAIDRGTLPFHPDWRKFAPTYPKDLTIESFRDVKSEIEAYKMGMTNLREVYGQRGKDYEIEVEQLIKEKEWIVDRCANSTVTPQEVIIINPNFLSEYGNKNKDTKTDE